MFTDLPAFLHKREGLSNAAHRLAMYNGSYRKEECCFAIQT